MSLTVAGDARHVGCVSDLLFPLLQSCSAASHPLCRGPRLCPSPTCLDLPGAGASGAGASIKPCLRLGLFSVGSFEWRFVCVNIWTFLRRDY